LKTSLTMKKKIIKEISEFCGLDYSFFENYNFQRFNETSFNQFPKFTKLYGQIFYKAKLVTLKYPRLFRGMQLIHHKLFKRIFKVINTKNKQKKLFKYDYISPSTLSFLRSYYSSYNQELIEKFDLNHNWD